MKTIVVGLGNPILSDDGAGPRVAAELKGLLGESDIEIEEANVGGLGLMSLLAGYQRAIIVDAIQTVNGTPGEIYQLDLAAFERSRSTGPLHDLDLLSALRIGRISGMTLPDMVEVFAIEAEDVCTFGEECSPLVSQAIPVCAEMIRRNIEGGNHA
jgi:hydrogenase maturation protease